MEMAGSMKTLATVISAIGLGILTSTAAIAGGSIKDDYAPAATYNWSGAYIGVHGGLATGNTTADADLLGFITVSTDYDMSGGFYGGHVGYNHQIGNAVFGIEGALSGGDISGSQSCVILFNCARNVDMLASVSGRIGYAMDRSMVYGSLGVAWADVETNVTDNIVGGGLINLRGGETHVGLRVGFGFEHAIAPNIVARVEYAHYQFGDETHNLGLEIGGTPVPLSIPSNVSLDMDTLNVGISIKFH